MLAVLNIFSVLGKELIKTWLKCEARCDMDEGAASIFLIFTAVSQFNVVLKVLFFEGSGSQSVVRIPLRVSENTKQRS
jgi:hypothetical protein